MSGSKRIKMNILDYIYYRFYRLWKLSSMPESAGILAACSVCLLIYFNLLPVYAYIRDHKYLDISKFNNWYFSHHYTGKVSIIILIVIFSIYFFVFNRHQKIKKKYEHETLEQRHVGTIILALYIILSFVFLIVIAFNQPGNK